MKAQQLYQEIQSLKMNMDPVLVKRIARYSISLVKKELQEVEKAARVNLSDPIRFWDELGKEVEKL